MDKISNLSEIDLDSLVHQFLYQYSLGLKKESTWLRAVPKN